MEEFKNRTFDEVALNRLKLKIFLLEKENLRFTDVIRLAQMAVPEEWHNREYLYFKDEVAEINENAEGGRGTKPISQEDGIVCYLAAYGKWHKSKLLPIKTIFFTAFLRKCMTKKRCICPKLLRR